MKLAIAWFSVLTLLIVISCSVNHRSGDYACTKQSDCASPRMCMDGFCIVPDGVPIDGPLDHVDARPGVDAGSSCPQLCTSCNLGTHTCKVDCSVPGANCNGGMSCPAGWNCTFNCSTNGACRNAVDCSQGKSCNFVCSGPNSCGDLTCPAGACTIACTGSNSCRNIACKASCACDVACGAASLCDTITCTSPTCDSPSGGCSSQNLGCNTCP